MIVEDEAAHAAAIKRAFETDGGGTQIEVVGTLREFRQHTAENPPDLALLDLNLPDGRAVEIMTNPPEAGPFPIMVMTSYGNEQVAVEAIKAGAWITWLNPPKPFHDAAHRGARVARMETAGRTPGGGGLAKTFDHPTGATPWRR